MHYHCEIIMPPRTDPDGVVKRVMEPFYEGEEDNHNAFWDWWVIGGRFSGSKVRARLDRRRIEGFYGELTKRRVTVSGVVVGKQSLQPASQIPGTDALWREWFPDSGLDVCPLFEHSGDRLADDICRVGDTPLAMKAGHVVVAGPHWKDTHRMEAQWMAQTSTWNGVNWLDTVWDGTVGHALKLYEEYRENYERLSPVTDDWLAVTVDYHT